MTSACFQEPYYINNSKIWAELSGNAVVLVEGCDICHLLSENKHPATHICRYVDSGDVTLTHPFSTNTRRLPALYHDATRCLGKRDFSQHTDLWTRRWMWMFYGYQGNSSTQSSWCVFLAESEKGFNDWCGLTAGWGSRSSSGCLRHLCHTQLILWWQFHDSVIIFGQSICLPWIITK